MEQRYDWEEKGPEKGGQGGAVHEVQQRGSLSDTDGPTDNPTIVLRHSVAPPRDTKKRRVYLHHLSVFLYFGVQ